MPPNSGARCPTSPPTFLLELEAEGFVGVGVAVTTTTTGVCVGVCVGAAVTTTTLSVGTVTGASVDARDGACAEVQATPNAAIPKSASTPVPIFDTIAEIKL